MKRFGSIIARMMVVLMMVLMMPVCAVSAQQPSDRGTTGSKDSQTQEILVDASEEGMPEMSILTGVNDIEGLLKLIVNILLYGLGAAAVVGTVIAGIMYLTARDSEQQVAKAKMRLFEISLGLLVWAMLFAALNWLIPGFSTDMLN